MLSPFRHYVFWLSRVGRACCHSSATTCLLCAWDVNAFAFSLLRFFFTHWACMLPLSRHYVFALACRACILPLPHHYVFAFARGVCTPLSFRYSVFALARQACVLPLSRHCVVSATTLLLSRVGRACCRSVATTFVLLRLRCVRPYLFRHCVFALARRACIL